MWKLYWPWKMQASYSDGYQKIMGGNSEAECMERLAALEEAHGEITWYSGVTDEDYESGEYIGQDSFEQKISDILRNRLANSWNVLQLRKEAPQERMRRRDWKARQKGMNLERMKEMRYYSIMRPIAPGTFPHPSGNRILDIENFDSRTYCKEIGRDAWGYIVYKQAISKEDASNYELIPFQETD